MILSKDYLTAGNLFTMMFNKVALFSKPSLHLVLEDLALRLSLEQLRTMFFQTIALVQQE